MTPGGIPFGNKIEKKRQPQTLGVVVSWRYFFLGSTFLDQATRAYLRADYDASISLLRREPGWASRILLAQSYFRAEHFAAAKATAAQARALAAGPIEIARTIAILALTVARAGDLAGAETLLEEVEPQEDDGAKSEIAFAKGFVAFSAGEIDLVESCAKAALDTGDVNARIRARNLLSFVYAERGDMHQHAALLRESFNEKGTDIYLRANTIHQISVIARETAVPLETESVTDAIVSLDWTKHLSARRFLSLKNFAWHFAINGNYERAYRFAEDAISVVPSDGWAVGAHTDYAQIAIAAGEKTSASVQLERASDKAAKIDWATCPGEERFALLDLSVLQSKRDQARAKRFLAQFDALDSLPSTLVFARDARAKALRLFAGAMQVGVNEADAVSALRDAHRIFIRYNYQWWGAAVASAIADVTKDQRWIDVARLHLQDFPRSWLSQAIVDRGVETDQRYDVLSPQQRRVFKLLLEGLGDREIAEKLGIAHKTARNHVQAVLDRLEVHSRRLLITEYNRRVS